MENLDGIIIAALAQILIRNNAWLQGTIAIAKLRYMHSMSSPKLALRPKTQVS
jgi:hypothetical protein